MVKQPIYFDNAAATPLDSKVLEAMRPYWADQYYNPSSLYEPARQVKQALGQARSQIAKILGARPPEIIFTAGATEANNLAIFGIANKHPKAEIVTTSIEHESVLGPVAKLKAKGYKIKKVSVNPDGTLDVSALQKAISHRTVLLSVIYANNEVGTIQPIAKIARLVKNIRQLRQSRKLTQPLYLHTDAAQAANYLDLHVSRLGVDLMTLNGSKIYGPKQTGCLYIRSQVDMEPLIFGGGQERGVRSGTENVAGSVGFAAALRIATDQRKTESARLSLLRDSFIARALREIKDTQLNGHQQLRLPNNINLTIKNVSGETLVHRLDALGILAATGSACSANNDQPSHVLKALGLSNKQINSSLRVSLGRSSTAADLDYLLKQLKLVVDKLRQF